MKTKGVAWQSGVVSQWAQRGRLAEKANQSGLARTPSARLMTTAHDYLAKSEAIPVAAIKVNVPELVVARRPLATSVRDPLEDSAKARRVAGRR